MPQPEYESIGKYQVKRIIRSTGSADLYECFDPDFSQPVAVKVFNVKKRLLKKLPYPVESWRRRFIREARLLAHIDHPHVVGVRELSKIDDKPFYVMPWVASCLTFEMGLDGNREDYAPEIRHAPDACKLSVSRTLDIWAQMASGLSAFHGRGLVHRDLKPGNILLTKLETGLVKLCDPGMVKFPNSEESQAGWWIGTEDYIAPEQKKNSQTVSASADIFAMGVLAYRMLAGCLPAGVDNGPIDEVEDLPEDLNALILKCMSRKVEKRPQNALALLHEIGPIRTRIRKKGR